ncbi:MAG: hypothetical protein A3H98_04955 [Bacteroidetes bacterium RIFCSPLOWO2_02_FULL_36_8]|nr:MAG: hypothetical protein A3H98_04955 [Bacteroidetes bacterium RIFCSPLOWO2_02_FULL_36_8]OFY71835.1 MAG: hypothetical protein A3G23_14575 [Bacteroidetes bacterium RIFCSPLOWO2_12_FULL_37_12]
MPPQNLFHQKSKIIVSCPKGLAPWLEEELKESGFNTTSNSHTWVGLDGDLMDCMRINYSTRIGHKVLFLLKDFIARDPKALFAAIKSFPWEIYLPSNGYFAVTSVVDNPTIRDTRYPNLVCKDAIVDRLKSVYHQRPDTGSEKNGIVVHLHWINESASVFLDTSGETLAKHGYRLNPFMAPLQETLAAALVRATGWDRKSPFVNPMCGSGTIIIEAALLLLGIYPALQRKNFAFMHLNGYNPDFVKTAVKNLKRNLTGINPEECNLTATDLSNVAIAAARTNATIAGVDKFISFKRCDFSETRITPTQKGIIFFNPGYGDRMGEEENLALEYKRMGDFMKQKCKGYTGVIFTGNSVLAKSVGLRTKRKIQFYNATIECRMLCYELF